MTGLRLKIWLRSWRGRIKVNKVREITITKNSEGYTLLELLAALAISAVVIGAMGGLLINGSQAYGRVDRHSELQENGRAGMEMMARDFKSSRQVVRISDREISIIGAEGSSIIYRVGNRTLYRAVPGTSNPVCMQVEEFIVEEAFPDLLKVKLITENHGTRYILQTQVMRRSD